MERLKSKFYILYLPFLLFSAGATLICALLIGAVIRLELFDPPKFFSIILLPATIGIGIGVFYFWKRIRLFRVSEGVDWIYLLLCIGMLALPVVFGNLFAGGRQTRLTEVDIPSEIASGSRAGYYSIREAYIETDRTGVYYDRKDIEGKYADGPRTFSVYFAAPLRDPADTLSTTVEPSDKWIAIHYSKEFSASRKITEKAVRKFIDQSNENFERHVFDTRHLRRQQPGDPAGYRLAARNSASAPEVGKMLILTEAEPGQSQSRGFVHWFVFALTIASLLGVNVIWLLLVSVTPVPQERINTFCSPERRREPLLPPGWRENEIVRLILPSRQFRVTPLLVAVNTVVFLLMVACGLSLFSPSREMLMEWGANYGPAVRSGEAWRLITSMFLHADILHLVFNMGALYFVGMFLERLIGSLRFGVIYLICGIFASAASAFINHPVTSVGASGAIFGMYGLALALAVTGKARKQMGGFAIGAVVFVGANFVPTMGVDFLNHLGGLVSGFLIGLTGLVPVNAPGKENG